VPSGHFGARLQTALDGDIDLDHLLHTRRQFIALRQLLALLFESHVETLARLFETLTQRFELMRDIVVGHPDVEPVMRFDPVEVFLRDRCSFDQPLRTAIGQLADDQTLDTGKGIALDDA